VLDRIATLESALKEAQGASGCVISESRPGFDKNVPCSPPSRPVQERSGASSPEKPEAIKAVQPLRVATNDVEPVPKASDFTDNCEPLPALDPEFSAEADLPLERNRKTSLPVTASEALEGWPGFVAFLANHDPIVWAKVSHCTVRSSGESLELEVPDIFEKSANGPEFIEKLGDACQAFFGSRFEWIIIKKQARTSESSAAKGHGTGKPSGTKQIVNHPAVQQAIEILGAELIEVKPYKGLDPNGFQDGKKNM
jgi:hypothetical protein